ncbi:MAG: carboxypeptidase-like regulatory domain-containing protein [Candidatus Sericytochromatia bacterium]|nr:carboxypeptidase-like regulatory domain-containing protein [Candidatus Sericytochromatia bacterium]
MMSRRQWLAAGLLAGACVPVPAAAASLWGYSGEGVLPGTRTLEAGEIGLSASALVLPGGASMMAPLGLAAGVLPGLEVALTAPFGQPGYSGVMAHVNARLSRPEDATRVVCGVTNLMGQDLRLAVGGAAESPSFVAANQLHLLVGRDLTLPIEGKEVVAGSWSMGFTGRMQAQAQFIRSRFVAGLTVPVARGGQAFAEYLGSSQTDDDSSLNLGVGWQVSKELALKLVTFGHPGRLVDFGARALSLGVTWRAPFAPATEASRNLQGTVARLDPAPLAGLVHAGLNGLEAAQPVVASESVVPPSPPAVAVWGRVRDGAGVPRSGVAVRLDGASRPMARTTTAKGFFLLAPVEKGTYDLVASDPTGRLVASRTIEVTGSGPLEVDLAASGNP